jgi:hypothetical protein
MSIIENNKILFKNDCRIEGREVDAEGIQKSSP